MRVNWEFLKAEEVYIYPSANSDDGGDINSEHNLSEITYKMIYKNYVVCHNGDIVKNSNDEIIKAPFLMTINGNSEVRITEGTAVLEGYLLKVYPVNAQYITYPIDSTHIRGLSEFISFSNEAYSKLYNQITGDKINYPPSYYEELGYSDLPRLHVVIKLLKNSTGNVRGDMIKRDNGVVVRVNKGIALSVLSDSDLSQLDVPYLVIGNLYYQNGTWISEENYDKYQYIHDTVIISPSPGLTMNEWVLQQVNKRLSHLDTITFMTKNSDGVFDKNLSLSVKDNNVKVTRYERSLGNSIVDDEINGEKTGEYVYSYSARDSLSDYDLTYSLDQLQQRTHVSSKYNETSSTDSRIAMLVDSRDSGDGYHIVWLGNRKSGYIEPGSPSNRDGYLNENGTSNLLARADHRHDKRYLLTSNAWLSDTEVQSLGTIIEFLETVRGSGWSIDDSGSASFSELNVYDDSNFQGNVVVGSNLTVNGEASFEENASFNKNVTILGILSTSQVEADRLVASHSLEVGSGSFVVDNSNSSIVIDLDTTTIMSDVEFTSKTSGVPTTFNSGALIKSGAEIRDGLSVSGGITVSSGGATIAGNVVVNGDITGTRVFNAVWNDYAELFLKGKDCEDIDPGTVICKIKGTDTYGPLSCDRLNRKLVVGVCSDSYGHLIGGDKDLTLSENLKKYVPVALSGRVYVKVEHNVVIEEGDLLVPSIGYYGRATTGNEKGCIIGKALESSDGHKDKVLMLVSLG